MRTVVITGGNGLVGSHLRTHLANSCDVHAPGRDALDLAAPLDRAALPASAGAVVHLAQSSRFREFPEGVDDMMAVNVARTLDLVRYAVAARATTFVYASTGGVYGTGPHPFRETDPAPPAEPLGFYPASKLAAELLLRPFEPLISVVILRFFFVYGAGQARGMLVPRLVDSVRERRPITLDGADGLTINPVHAGDAAAAVAAAVTLTQSAVINVAGPETLTLRAMAEKIGEATGVAPFFQTRSIPSSGLVADTGRMRTLLSAPGRMFSDGVRDVL